MFYRVGLSRSCFWLVALSGLYVLGGPVTLSAPSYQKLLDKAIEHGFPGIVLAVNAPGQGLWIGAAGMAEIETQTAMEPDDVFHIASITKALTAVAVLKLVDRQILSLDDTLSGLLGAKVERIPNAEKITVAQLLDHSSGIYAFNNDMRYLNTLVGPDADQGKTWSPEELVAFADKDRNAPSGKPGEGYFYSDVNYVLLGMIVEHVTNTSFREFVKETILRHLNLSSMVFLNDVAEGKVPKPEKTADGYIVLSEDLLSFIQISDHFPRVTEKLANTSTTGERIDAAAGMLGNARDLAAFGTALFGGKLLSPTSQARLFSFAEGLEREPIGTVRRNALVAYHKPYGVLITAQGDGPGVNTLLAYHPESGIMTVFLTNIFGLFDEKDFMMDVLIPKIVAGNIEKD